MIRTKSNNYSIHSSLNDDLVLRQNYFQQKELNQEKQIKYQPVIYQSLYDNCLVESNMSKSRKYLRVNFDKFTLLNEDKKINMYNLNKNRREETSKKCIAPKETPIYYKWEKTRLPKIKLVPTNITQPVLDLSERKAERRMKLAFQQKQEEEMKKNELENRILNLNRHRESLNETCMTKNRSVTSSNNNLNRVASTSTNGSLDSAFQKTGKYSPNFEKEDISTGPAVSTEIKKVLNKLTPLVNYNTTKGFKYLFSFKDFN